MRVTDSTGHLKRHETRGHRLNVLILSTDDLLQGNANN